MCICSLCTEDILRSLEENKLSDKVNLIILSDHGMAAVTREVQIKDYLDLTDKDIEVISEY